MIDNDLELFRSLVGVFAEDYPVVLANLRQAISDKDGAAVEKSGHRIKGNVRNFYSDKLAAQALQIEEAGRESNFSELMTKVDSLEVGLKDLERDLQLCLQHLQTEAT